VVNDDEAEPGDGHYTNIRVEVMMAGVRQRRHKRWAAAILEAELSPLDKVRKLVALGYDETEAEALVSGTQTGVRQPLYYEQLPGPEYARE
jgi:hypothetical protein